MVWSTEAAVLLLPWPPEGRAENPACPPPSQPLHVRFAAPLEELGDDVLRPRWITLWNVLLGKGDMLQCCDQGSLERSAYKLDLGTSMLPRWSLYTSWYALLNPLSLSLGFASLSSFFESLSAKLCLVFLCCRWLPSWKVRRSLVFSYGLHGGA